MKQIILLILISIPYSSTAQEYYTFAVDTNKEYTYIEPDSFLREGVFDDNNSIDFKLLVKPKSYFEVSHSAYLGGQKTGITLLGVFNRNDERMGLNFFSFDTDKGIISRIGEGKSHIAYQIESLGSERVMKLELRNVTYNFSDPSDSLNFQIWIFENGVIEYRYGDCNITDFEDAFGDILPEGPRIRFGCSGEYDGKPGNVEYDVYFTLYDNPENPRIIKQQSPVSLKGIPKSGTVYRFTPQIFYTDVNDKFLRVRLETYPNPAAEKIYFHNKHLTYPLNVTITNIAGQRQTLVLNQGENEISLAQKGVLIIELQDAAGRKYSQKVVSK
jgi:hypothetical protein